MGGALALLLAARRPEVEALAVLAPALAFNGPWIRFTPWPKHLFRESFPAPRGAGWIDPEAERLGWGYDRLPVAAAEQLWRLVRCVREELPRVTQPLLVLHGREDRTIPGRAALMAHDRVSSRIKRLVWIEGSGHVLTLDAARERVLGLVADWFVEREAARRDGDAA